MSVLIITPLKRAYARAATRMRYDLDDVAIVRPVPKALVVLKRDVWIKQHVDDVVLHFDIALDPWGDDHNVLKVWAEIYSDEESDYVTRALTPDEIAGAMNLIKAPMTWTSVLKHANDISG